MTQDKISTDTQKEFILKIYVDEYLSSYSTRENDQGQFSYRKLFKKFFIFMYKLSEYKPSKHNIKKKGMSRSKKGN